MPVANTQNKPLYAVLYYKSRTPAENSHEPHHCLQSSMKTALRAGNKACFFKAEVWECKRKRVQFGCDQSVDPRVRVFSKHGGKTETMKADDDTKRSEQLDKCKRKKEDTAAEAKKRKRGL